MSVSKFLIYELTVSIFCFFVLSHLRQDSPENIRGQENGMIPQALANPVKKLKLLCALSCSVLLITTASGKTPLILMLTFNCVSSQENLSSGFPIGKDLSQAAQSHIKLHKLVRDL